MSPYGLVVDGFWLCLRPAFSQFLLKNPVIVLPHRRLVHTTAPAFTASSSPHTTAEASAPEITSLQNSPRGSIINKKTKTERPIAIPHKRKPIKPSYQWIPPIEWRLKESVPPDLSKMSTTRLENRLQEVVADRPSYISAIRIAQELIGNRGVKPTTRHYKAMILANADSYRGSPVQVRKLLKEMQANDIVIDSGILHAALKVLAIHPDYILRQEILHTLRERWISLSPAGWHHVAAGFIRERQYEMALNTLSHMEAQQIPVQDWLYGLLIYNLCDAEEYDEALNLMKARLASGHELSPNLWYRVLDLASDALHEDMVSFIWRRRVETGYINPSHGVCNNVLTIASRSGNIELATSVFQVLEERGSPFTLNDYEALIDTYAAAGDIESALRLVCTAKATGSDITENSTRSILVQLLRGVGPQCLDLWATVKRMREEESIQIPLIAVHLVLEYCARCRDADAAMQVYKELHLVSSVPKTTETFNKLLRVCRRTNRLDMATFYLEEMRLAKILPNVVTYTNLIFMCAMEGRFKEALNFFLEMTNSGFSMGFGRRKSLKELCNQTDDPDALALLRALVVYQPMPRHVTPEDRKGMKTAEEAGAKEPDNGSPASENGV